MKTLPRFRIVTTAWISGNSITEPFKEYSITALVLKALIRKLDLQTNFYDRLWATLDTAIVMSKARYVA